MSPNNLPVKKRIDLLDAWRGTAVIVMAAWHFAWDLGSAAVFPLSRMFEAPATAVRYFIVGSFLLLSGISARLSRSNLRRGLRTLGCALAVTAVTYLAKDPVLFGILHLLGCCMLLYAAVEKPFERVNAPLAAGICLALFFLTFRVPDLRVQNPWIWMFGFRTEAFYSSDYYPLLPWGFLFFFGAAAGSRARDLPEIQCPAWLCGIGRHALAIYLIHQPVLVVVTGLLTGYYPWS